jgi:hypothetical protein
MAAVLFTDLVGSTELLSTLGESAFDDVRRDHFASLRGVVTRHGGEEIKTLGDGILAVFASAASAVAAAVTAQQAARRRSLSIRVGLAAGDVAFEDDDVFGAPVVEAARLVAAARPEQILATTLVRGMAGGRSRAAFVDLGNLELKGLTEPVPVCEVAWEPGPGVGEAVPLSGVLTGGGPVFVGREAEIERLGRTWKEVREGDRRLVLLAGEPGVGKTRLAAELATAVRSDGGVVLAGRCDDDMGVPYQPFAEALRHYATHAPEPHLGRSPGELTRLVPDLPELVPGLPEALRSDPDTERYRLFDALASWFSDMSADTPVLLVLDDLHWAAGPTVLLLRHLLRSAVPLRLLTLGTYRDTDLGRDSPLGRWLGELRRLPGAECLALTGLDQAGVGAFLEALSGHALDGEDGDSLVRAVWEGTEGNPFFVDETLRHLSESGAVVRQGDRWVVTVKDLGIPPGVREVVRARLFRLSGQANRALSAAAVAGLEFEPAVVRIAAGLGEEDLATALDEALAAHVVVEVPGIVPRNRFAHALVRATVYDEQSAARKVMLHRKVAEAIETVHAGALGAHLPALAHHCARSAVSTPEVARAVDYAARAGDRALAQLAPQEAVTFYRSALDLLADSGDPAEEDRRSDLMISLGDAQQQAGDPDHRDTLLSQARKAQRRDDGPRLIRAVLANYRGSFSSAGQVDDERVATLEAALHAAGGGDDLLRARLLSQLVMEQAFAANVEQRQQQSAEALALARRAGDPEVLIRAINARVFAIWHPSHVRERMVLGEEAFSIGTEGLDPGQRLLTMTRASFARMEVGDRPGFEGILALLESAISDVVHPYLRCVALLKLGTGRLMHGDFEAAERFCNQGSAVGEASGVLDTAVYVLVQRFGIAYDQGRLEPWITGPLTALAEGLLLPAFQAILGVVHAELGQTAEATVVLDRLAGTGFDCLPPDLNWGPSLALAASLCHLLHHQRGAVAVHQLLEPYADLAAGHSLMFAGSYSHALGLLATTLGRLDEADARFAAGLAMHEQLDAPVWLARTRLEWGRMLLQRKWSGDAERARGLLGQALDFGRHHPQPAIEARAAAALQEVG